MRSTITKVNIEHLEKVIKKFLRNVFTLTIVSMATVELMIGYSNNVKHMNSQKKWNLFPFGNTDLKQVLMKRRSTYINIRTSQLQSQITAYMKLYLFTFFFIITIITILIIYLIIHFFSYVYFYSMYLLYGIYILYKLMSISCILFYCLSFFP